MDENEYEKALQEDRKKRGGEADKNCRCKPKCLDCRDGVHDGCMYGCR